jgi:hypothetical protein
MTRISSGLLNDTLNLVQLARETALQQGKQEQAKRLSPVVNEMRNMVTTTQQAQTPAKPTGMLAQDDFRSLLAASQASKTLPALNTTQTPTTGGAQTQSSNRTVGSVNAASTNSVTNAYSSNQGVSGLERNRIVAAMSKGNMSDIDIARQMGMTREEVRLILNINQRTQNSSEG